MYTREEVEAALDTESLSDALYKLERFAEVQGLTELAMWCRHELTGYEDGASADEFRAYRMLAVEWVDVDGRPIAIIGERASDFAQTPLRLGVLKAEGFTRQNAVLPFPDLADSMAKQIGRPVRGALARGSDFEDVLRRVRFEARRRLHDAVGRAPIPGPSAEVRSRSINDAIRQPSGLAWDVFISHASEDKDEVARPLAELLRKLGFRVWYDEYTLRLGDSLRRKIDEGLAKCRFGVVVLSPAFFAKEWPKRELDGLFAREVTGGKVVLPVWHRIDYDGVAQRSPMLADRYAVSTTKGLAEVARTVAEILRDESGPAQQGVPSVLLEYDGHFDTDLRRHSVIFSVRAGEHRMLCVIPFEDIADAYHLDGDQAEMLAAFNQHLQEIMQAAQRAYNESERNATGELVVRLL